MSTQNINLYLPEFRKERTWLDARQLAQATLLVLVVLVGLSSWYHWKIQGLEQRYTQVDQQYSALVDANTALETAIANDNVLAAVQDDIDRLETALKQKQAILALLNGQDIGNAVGFSSHLTELSRYLTQGVSLQHIRLDEGGAVVGLRGHVLSAELVPRYLQSLSQGQRFRGMDFDTLQILEESDAPSAPETGARPEQWAFSVATATSATGATGQER